MLEDIRKLIAEILKTTKEREPSVIAELVVKEIPAKEIKSFLAYYLRDEVRHEMRIARMSARSGGTENNFSARWTGAAAAKFSQLRYYVSGTWKLFGELTVEDVENLADGYYAEAKTNMKHGDQWTALAKEMRKKKVATVGELGEEKAGELISA